MFGFPKADRPVNQGFNNNFLRQVIWQIKFPPNDLVTSKRDKIASLFSNVLPNLKIGTTTEFEIQAGAGLPVVRPKQNNTPTFQLLSKDEQKVLSFESDIINYTIQGPAYKNFEQLSAETEIIYDILLECNVQVINRAAIRKINIIKFAYNDDAHTPAVDFNAFILNPDIRADFANFPNRQLIQQTIQSVNYLSNDAALNLKYGLIVPEKGDASGEYVIDIDLFKQQEIATNELKSTFSSINEEIFNVFIWLLSPVAKSSLQHHADAPSTNA